MHICRGLKCGPEFFPDSNCFPSFWLTKWFLFILSLLCGTGPFFQPWLPGAAYPSSPVLPARPLRPFTSAGNVALG